MWGALPYGRTSRLQLLLVLASVVIVRSESRGTHDHILLSQIRESPNLVGQVRRIYIPQEQGGPVIPQGSGVPFRRGRDHVENTVSSTDRTENVSSVIAYSLVTGDTTCAQISSLATAVVLTFIQLLLGNGSTCHSIFW
jgi:hypothetical protein